MRSTIILAITIFSSLAMALPPGGGRPTKPGRAKENKAASLEVAQRAAEKLNQTLSESVGIRNQYDVSRVLESIPEAQRGKLVEGMKELQKDLETQVNAGRLNEAEAKLKIDTMVEAHNAALNARETLADSVKEIKENKEEGYNKAAEAGKLIIEAIDNFNILRSKVNETAKDGVSSDLIILTYQTISQKVSSTNLSAKEILALRDSIEKPFEAQGIILAEIARCR